MNIRILSNTSPTLAAVAFLAAIPLSQAAVVTFSTDPDIAGSWTEYSYFGTENGNPTWNNTDEDLDLTVGGGAVLGLYETGTTRAPADTVTLVVSDFSRSGGTWGYAGLMITSTQQQDYIAGTGDSYAFVMFATGGGNFQYEVRGSYGDDGNDFWYYQGTSQAFSGPIDLSIERAGDDYLFKANGTTLYMSGTDSFDDYDTASKDSMIYYQIIQGGDGAVTTALDNFGVIPEPSSLALLGLGSLGLLKRRRR